MDLVSVTNAPIDKPGFFAMGADRYHADPCAVPSLSSSLAKVVINETPRHAFLQHPALNKNYERKDDSKFDLGSVAHEMLLGKGGGFEVLDFDDYKSKAAQSARDLARLDGLTPILREQHEQATRMVEAVRFRMAEIPDCADLFKPGQGAAEVVGVWQDIGGPICRMMIDWLASPTDIVDFKTTKAGLSDDEIDRTISDLDYDLSAGFYIRGLTHLMPDLAGRFRYRWVFAETTEPFEVRVVEPDAQTLDHGHRKAALAIAKWQKAMATGTWPGYARRPYLCNKPSWAGQKWIMREAADPDYEDAVGIRLDSPRAPAIEAEPTTITFGERLIHLPREA